MRTLLLGLLTIVLVVICLALAIGIPLGIGWILTLFLPFSLFEGTLLGMIASLVTGMIWYTIFHSDSSPEFEEEENDTEADEILESRFWKTNAERTWENWLRYLIANSVYEDLLDSPRWMEVTSEEQQELSIHLADAALRILKTKTPRATRLRVSKGRLKNEMVKMEQPPYENGILNTGVAAVNVVLGPMEAVLRRIVREQLWDDPAGINSS